MITQELLDALKAKCHHAVDGLIDAHNKSTGKYSANAEELSQISKAARDGIDAVRQIELLLSEATNTVDVPRQEYEVVQGHRQDDTVERHESFGLLQVSRVTGRVKLVGTTTDSLPHFVELRVRRAKRYTDKFLLTERYHEEGIPLISIRMSSYQWAEAITNLNGTGVPVTVAHVLGTEMEDVPSEVRTPFEQAVEDAQGRVNPDVAIENFRKSLDDVLARVEKLGLTKKKETELRESLEKLYSKHFEGPQSASEWAIRRINEEAERAVSSAKVEIDAALTSLIARTGIQTLKEEGAKLLLGEEG